jgi:hypothetical protein
MAEKLESRIKRELDAMREEPWLPIESRLISWSLALGAVLLIVLIWASYSFFPTS